MKRKHILFTIMGKVPNVITQALWCLKIQRQPDPINISRIVIITTLTGKKILSKGDPETGLQPFTGEAGAFNKYCKEFNTFPNLSDEDIHVICDENGEELSDIRTSKHFEMISNSIINVLRELTKQPDNVLHCIYSGGRRAMAVYLGLALTLLGRKQDRFYYVRLSPRSAMAPSFFYPQNNENVELSLQEIPFARLGEKYSNILTEKDSFSDLVNNIQNQVDLTTSPIRVSAGEPVEIIGDDPKFRFILSQIEKLAKDDAIKKILLYGESGTGKEVVAEFFHSHSSERRRNKVFLRINCASFSPDLLEMELFGYVKGSHSRAYKDKIGLLEAADGGTIFLDEINSTEPMFQAKLLRFLEDEKVRKVGAIKEVEVDVRIILGLNEKPIDLIKEKRLRNDFYQRISEFEYTIPPLRDRQEDIIPLANYFLDKFKNDFKKYKLEKISKNVLKKLKSHHFRDSNVRGLRNIIKYIVVFADNDQRILTSLPEYFEVDEISQTEDDKSILAQKTLDYDKLLDLPHFEFQRVYFEHQMEIHKGNISSAANSLGIPRTTLQSKLDELGVDPARFRQ